jgi:hypothetical protein
LQLNALPLGARITGFIPHPCFNITTLRCEEKEQSYSSFFQIRDFLVWKQNISGGFPPPVARKMP